MSLTARAYEPHRRLKPLRNPSSVPYGREDLVEEGITPIPRPPSPVLPSNPYLLTNKTLPSLPLTQTVPLFARTNNNNNHNNSAHASSSTLKRPGQGEPENSFAFTTSSLGHTSGATSYPTAPQSLGDYEQFATLPDAPHRQAWSSQPTFRWFKRSKYDPKEVPDRWCRKGPKFSTARGDNFYRPKSLEEQRIINARIKLRIETKGYPRLGEW